MRLTAGPGQPPVPALRLSAPAIAACFSLACGGDGPTVPSRGAVITFRVVDETFSVQLLDERQMSAALQAATGGRARFPTAAWSPGPASMPDGLGISRTSSSWNRRPRCATAAPQTLNVKASASVGGDSARGPLG